MDENFPNKVISIRDNNLENNIKRFSKLVVNYWASWCGPCRIVGPITDDLAQELHGKIVFRKANLEIEDFNAVIKGITSVAIHPIPIKFPFPIRISANADLSTLFPLFSFPLHSLKFWNMPEMDIITPIHFGGILGLLKIPITFTTHYNFIPLAFTCVEKISVTVEEGTYDAWRIKSIIGDFFEYYYAPMVGNLIKVDINMPNGGMKGELKEKNY